MKISYTIVAVTLVTGATACGQSDGVATETSEPTELTEEQAVTEESTIESKVTEIAPGLTAKVLKNGYGRVAEAGDYVEVHYTGWLYDDQADDNRGDKFDSSVDRGEKFHFRSGCCRHAYRRKARTDPGARNGLWRSRGRQRNSTWCRASIRSRIVRSRRSQ